MENFTWSIWTTADWDDIIVKFKKTITETRNWLLDYKKYQYEILNQNEVIMWTFEIDQNTKFNNEIYFDEGEVETEKYWYARKWIISQLYLAVNQYIYQQYQTVLYSDRTSISLKMSNMRQKLVDQSKAEFLWYNTTWITNFDSKPWPTPMYRMLPPIIDIVLKIHFIYYIS